MLTRHNYLAKGGVLILTALFTVCGVHARRIPPHPDRLSYPPLSWEIPLGKPYRRTLANGLRAYIVPEHRFPVVRIVGYVRAGTLADPEGKEGVSSLTFQLMRTGGTEAFPADTFDALCERLAISISSSCTQSHGYFKASFLSEYTDTAMFMLEQMLFHPVFAHNRVEQEKSITVEKIRHRFDDPGPTLSAAYYAAMYPGGANSRLATEQGVKAISPHDLSAFHAAVMKTENVILGVSGDFDTEKMIRRLERMFPMAGNDTGVTFPTVAIRPYVKCLVVHKPISQAYVRMGLPLFKRPHPDYYPVTVLDQVLGGSSFISRLGTTVRSDEGLTYSIHSEAESNYTFAGTLYISFFTRQETVNKAIAICRRESSKLVDAGITAEELASAKRILIDALPSMFRSADDIADVYSWNEYYGRSEDHFTAYPAKINALTQNDIARVARTYLVVDSLTYVVVGDTSKLFSQEAFDGFSLQNITPMNVICPDDIESIGKE